uniref:ABC transmembrane type-1 domain-containing protein n=1 Tax=Glossina palpalis gambiensis TaxID=67801 RepID=A0A1B0C3U1_9MUSC
MEVPHNFQVVNAHTEFHEFSRKQIKDYEKNIYHVTRSAVYSLTNQTFQGLTTIKALEAERVLENEFNGYQNSHTSAWFLFLSSNRAFALWTDVISVIYIGLVTISFLVLPTNFNSGDVSLAILQSTTMIGMCQWLMRQTVDLENQMTISSDLVKRRLDKGVYKRLDVFEEDNVLVVCRTDSDVFQDSTELQSFFIKKRSEIRADTLSSAALDYSLDKMISEIEIMKQQKLPQEEPD